MSDNQIKVSWDSTGSEAILAGRPLISYRMVFIDASSPSDPEPGTRTYWESVPEYEYYAKWLNNE